MSLYLFALLIGVIAGLRAMTAPAAVAWGAYLGWIPLAGFPLAWMAAPATPTGSTATVSAGSRRNSGQRISCQRRRGRAPSCRITRSPS